jgi:hypothetical protein
VQVHSSLLKKTGGAEARNYMIFFKKLQAEISFRMQQIQELIWAVRAPVLTKALSISSIPFRINGVDGICNPSITRFNGEWIVAARRANYKMSSSGVYTVKGGIRKLNSDTFIVRCDEDLNPGSVTKLDAFSASQAYQNARNGFEDPRLFEFNGELTGLWSAMRLGTQDFDAPDQPPEDQTTSFRPTWSGTTNVMTVAEIYGDQISNPLELPSPHGLSREKNWMPFVIDGVLHLVYYLERMEVYRLVDGKLELAHLSPDVNAELRGWSGSSQFIQWDGNWLCVAHFAGRRVKQTIKSIGALYLHRFVVISPDWKIVGMSKRFFFEKRGLEFCAGLGVDGERLILSYGIDDRRAALLELDRNIVQGMIKVVG